MRVEYEKEIHHLKKQLQAAEQENKKLLDTLIKHSKGEDILKSKDQFAPGSAQAIFRQSQARSNWNKPIGKTKTRTLTLKQLKDLINDIYTQKVKYDQKCEESRLPRETMEQFMYTYLN